jgi:putative SOS response-associated peptidase YedK
MFRDASRRHRCLVVTDGFYKRKKTTLAEKIPIHSALLEGFEKLYGYTSDDRPLY